MTLIDVRDRESEGEMEEKYIVNLAYKIVIAFISDSENLYNKDLIDSFNAFSVDVKATTDTLGPSYSRRAIQNNTEDVQLLRCILV